MKVSIIIPVYRVEQTLDRCVESVVGQSYTDIEVILVDDGSPDNCPAMCDEWARKDDRIRVVHQENGGLSAARNTGIDRAQGELLTFVDSDDYLAPETYSHAVAAMTADTDIVEFPVSRFHKSQWQKELRFTPAVYDDMKDYWLNGRAYEHCYAWNKLYRRELFREVRFPAGRVFEDVSTLPLLLQKTRRVAVIDQGLYYYCLNEQGITSTARHPQLGQLLDAHLAVIDRWCDDRYYMHVLNIQMDVAEQSAQEESNQPNTATGTIILPMRHVCPFASVLNTTERLKACILNIIGIKRLCKLSKAIHRWKKPRHS